MKLPLWCLAVLLAVVASGILVVRNAHEVRTTHIELEATAKRYNALLDEKTRLLLERGAHASYSHVEQVAATELDMHFPLADVGIVVGPNVGPNVDPNVGAGRASARTAVEGGQ